MLTTRPSESTRLRSMPHRPSGALHCRRLPDAVQGGLQLGEHRGRTHREECQAGQRGDDAFARIAGACDHVLHRLGAVAAEQPGELGVQIAPRRLLPVEETRDAEHDHDAAARSKTPCSTRSPRPCSARSRRSRRWRPPWSSTTGRWVSRRLGSSWGPHSCVGGFLRPVQPLPARVREIATRPPFRAVFDPVALHIARRVPEIHRSASARIGGEARPRAVIRLRRAAA